MVSKLSAFERPAQPALFVETGRVPIGASDGNRISLQHCVVACLYFDILAIAGLGFFSTAIEAGFGLSPSTLSADQALPIGFALFLFILLSRNADVYNTLRILELRHSVCGLVTSLFITFTVLLILAAATKTTQIYSRVWFFSWAALTCAILPVFRAVALAYIRNQLNNKGAFVYRALSAGIYSDPLSREEIALRTENRVKTVYAMRLEGFGALAEIQKVIARENIDQIYVTTPWANAPIALQHLELLRKFSAQVFVLPDHQRVWSLLGVSTFGNRLSLTAVERPIDGWDLWLKRMQDIVVATISLALFSPVMLGVVLAIKLEGRGPIFFRQKRTGFNGSIFEVWKFRSMYVEQTDPGALKQTGKSDPRVTRVGRFIRHMSIDELPQFFNVLEGSMSVVGPRPHALDTRAEGQLLDKVIDSYADRQRVKPGVTGWAQINGLRGELDSSKKVEQRVKYDLEYIEKWSLWLDLQIILRTAILIFYDPAAY
jgi:Undecaprenyl-phosphate glucose phosphotransferase